MYWNGYLVTTMRRLDAIHNTLVVLPMTFQLSWKKGDRKSKLIKDIGTHARGNIEHIETNRRGLSLAVLSRDT